MCISEPPAIQFAGADYYVMSEPIHIISLGAGVQSSTMALMAAAGEITPMPIAAIFADTQAEPKSVYMWLDWLEKQLPFPVHRVTKGSLDTFSTTIRYSEKNGRPTFSGVPAFVLNNDGSKGISPRQCTRDFKIDPCTKAVNGIRRLNGNIPAILWIGISTDEVWRAKPHRNEPRITNRFPLFEKQFNRQNCLDWMTARSFPSPPRSACVFCPYHSDKEWLRMKSKEPEEFQRAVDYEFRFQVMTAKSKLEGVPFLHRSCIPLSEVDFSTEEERGQLSMFNNECEGMCGV